MKNFVANIFFKLVSASCTGIRAKELVTYWDLCIKGWRSYLVLFIIHLVRGSAQFLLLVRRSCDHVYIHYAYLWYIYDDNVCLLHLSFHVLFLFFLYTHVSYYLYAIYYFCFTLRCCDEFCLKCFRNTVCQSLSWHRLSSCKVFQEFVLG